MDELPSGAVARELRQLRVCLSCTEVAFFCCCWLLFPPTLREPSGGGEGFSSFGKGLSTGAACLAGEGDGCVADETTGAEFAESDDVDGESDVRTLWFKLTLLSIRSTLC